MKLAKSRTILSASNLTKEKYSTDESWVDFFAKEYDLSNVPYHISWYVMFSILFADPKFKKINDKLKDKVNDNKNIKIYPLPLHVFKAFLVTPASTVKVVFIGQDPYFNSEQIGDTYVPQAMGLSFSVSHGMKFPSSLENIFANMIKYGHLKEKPQTGNLWYWAAQGCLMLNAALTVEDGKKEAHLYWWEWFTDYVIKYISDNMSDIIFVLWGAYAYKKINLIDAERHHTIISSHPSGYSANNPFKTFPAFMNEDHFGKINEILKKKNKQQILWN